MRRRWLCGMLLIGLTSCAQEGSRPNRAVKKGEVLALSEATFEQQVLQSKKPVVVDYWAPWCGPCLDLAPAVEELAGALGDKVRVAKINIDDAPNVTEQYNVASIPTLILYRDGKEVARRTGLPRGDAGLALTDWVEDRLR